MSSGNQLAPRGARTNQFFGGHGGLAAGALLWTTLSWGGGFAEAKERAPDKVFESEAFKMKAPAHWKLESQEGGLHILRGRTGKLYLWLAEAGERTTRDLWNRFLRKVIGSRIGTAKVSKYREKRVEGTTAGFALVSGRSRLNKVGERGTGPTFQFAVLLEKRKGRVFGAALGGTRGAGFGKQVQRLKRILGSLKRKS